ncbi:MAG TPA: hypothetical protein VI197_24230 [Polyangiaceae bacterium]
MNALSTLACATGLVLLTVVFAQAWLNMPIPDTLPMLISAIAGFEIFMVIDALRRRRAGGGTNG